MLTSLIRHPLCIILKNTETAIQEIVRSVVVVLQFRHTKSHVGQIENVVLIGRICDLILGILAIHGNAETLARHNGFHEFNTNNVLEFLLRGETGTESLAVGGGIKVDRKAVPVLLVIAEPITISRIDKEIVFDLTVAHNLVFADDVVLRQDHFVNG